MAWMPRVTGTEVVSALRKAGWQVSDQSGSHAQLRHQTRPDKVTVPLHRGKALKLGTLGSILDQAGLGVDAFRDLL